MIDWNVTVREIGPKLLRYFSIRTDRSVAPDLVQETLLRLCQNVRRGDYNPQLGSLQMYAFGIGRLVLKENIRKTWEMEPLDDNLSDSRSSNYDNASASLISLSRAIKKLSPIEQDVILFFSQGFTINEIAASLTIPEGTVKSHISRARSKLTSLMGGETNV